MIFSYPLSGSGVYFLYCICEFIFEKVFGGVRGLVSLHLSPENSCLYGLLRFLTRLTVIISVTLLHINVAFSGVYGSYPCFGSLVCAPLLIYLLTLSPPHIEFSSVISLLDLISPYPSRLIWAPEWLWPPLSSHILMSGASCP